MIYPELKNRSDSIMLDLSLLLNVHSVALHHLNLSLHFYL